jgi:hypothetical protein
MAGAGEKAMNTVPHLVRLGELDVFKATQWEKEVLAKLGKTAQTSACNPDGIGRADRFKIGYLGELAVADTLRHFGIAYVHKVNLTGEAGPPEFTVANSHRATLEVKATGGADNKLLLVAVAQVKRHGTASYYIGTRIEQLTETFADVSVWGYVTGAQITQLETREDICPLSYWKPLAGLGSLIELMGMLTTVQQVVHKELTA